MIRLPFLFICFFQLKNLLAQEQLFKFNYKIGYSMEYRPDSTSLDTKTMDMVLLINDSFSLFESLSRYQKDSVMYHHQPDEYSKERLIGVLPFALVNKTTYQILKDDQKITTYDMPFGSRGFNGKTEVYQYEEAINVLEWEIQEDTLSLSGFPCQKAILHYGGRIWNAYFTSEIPVSDGPYKFCGLPGLIIRIEDSQKHWSFNLVGIQKTPTDVAINFQKWLIFKKVDKKRFFKDRKEFQQHLFHTMRSLGIDLPENTVNDYKEKLAADNNWIELYP